MQQPFRAAALSADKSFTQNWLQSLTLVAQNPVARQIKPMLDSVNDLTRFNSEANRLESARKLWDFASAEKLGGLLEILPTQQGVWKFGDDETFVFHHGRIEPIADFDSWTKYIGLVPGDFALVADVTSSDWTTLLRQEAVRQRRSTSVAAMPQGMNLQLPCTAHWDLKNWSIRFDQADWVEVRYDDPFTVNRPAFTDLYEKMMWMVAEAQERLIPKSVSKCTFDATSPAWVTCEDCFTDLHDRVLSRETTYCSPWLRRTWACVWPVIYREQNVLRGHAQIDPIRQEIAACMGAVPQLTMWMFVMAKLVCESQFGRGLGISGHYAA